MGWQEWPGHWVWPLHACAAAAPHLDTACGGRGICGVGPAGRRVPSTPGQPEGLRGTQRAGVTHVSSQVGPLWEDAPDPWHGAENKSDTRLRAATHTHSPRPPRRDQPHCTRPAPRGSPHHQGPPSRPAPTQTLQVRSPPTGAFHHTTSLVRRLQGQQSGSVSGRRTNLPLAVATGPPSTVQRPASLHQGPHAHPG